MKTDVGQRLREKLTSLLQSDTVLAEVFPMLGEIERAKFSRGRMLVKIASDNGFDTQVAEEAAVGLELVHLATLVHDDVIDDSDLRRNKANIRSVKNDRAAILFGDYLFSKAIRQIQKTQPPLCAAIFTEQVEDTCRGESIQDLLLTWEDSKPNLDLLHQAARGKTGALFSFCLQAPFAISPDPNPEILELAKEAGYLCGLGFQLADDLLDIVGSSDNLGKPAGNDLIKNTMTTPLFLLMEEQEMDWPSFRKQFTQDTTCLRSTFLSSGAFKNLIETIETSREQLFDLGQKMEHQGLCILKTLKFFWANYVEQRMETFKDLQPTH